MKYYSKLNYKDLMPHEIKNNIHKLKEQIHIKPIEKVVHTAYIIPAKSSCTWYLTEYDEETGIGYGLIAGDKVKWDYFNIKELVKRGAERLITEDFPKPFKELYIELTKQLYKSEFDKIFNTN